MGGLIIPPSAFLLDARVFASLGILKVASSLELEGIPVEVVDLSGVANFEDAAATYAESKPDWVGITATTPQMPSVADIVTVFRRVSPSTKIILGGAHPTLVNAAARGEVLTKRKGRSLEALAQLLATFDVVVAGDGEKSILKAIHKDTTGLVDADDPKSPFFLTEWDLATAPLPARHLLDLSSYRYSIDGAPATNIVAQIVCPFQCAFCGGRASPMLRRFRTRQSREVVRELAHLHDQYGYRGFMFTDDELNVSRSMPELMEQISDLAESRGTEFKLRGFIKSELFTDEQARALKKAGFRWLLVGFESGSERVLKNCNKKATVADNTRCMDIAKKHGLKVKALMSLGHAGESQETINETTEWLLKMKVDDFDATIITTYPGSPYYDQAVETAPGVWTFTAKGGDKLHSYQLDYSKVADYYKGDPNQGYKAYVFTDHLSCDGLVDLRGKLEEKVRRELGIPFNPGAPAMMYEHSMGQTGLPPNILRSSHSATVKGVGT
jgi:anaerobic magnesium-protoporphyrin IX monomethyl ester cyclase